MKHSLCNINAACRPVSFPFLRMDVLPQDEMRDVRLGYKYDVMPVTGR